MQFATRALRVAQAPDSKFRAVIPPIYQSSTFAWESLDDVPKVDYTRCANPNRQILEEVIASLENGKYANVFGSGMAAICSCFSLLKSGDHLLMAGDIYGGTFRLGEKYLPRQGVTVSQFCSRNPHSIDDVVTPETKMLIFETPSNPNLRVCDIEAVVKQAKKHGLIVVFDNTFASPYHQNPLDLGVDLVLHSTTKYIAGHSDVIGGVVVTNNEDFQSWIFEWLKATGATPSPFDCWLSLRGLKTMALRMERHSANALALAHFFAEHPKVTSVHYPGLPTHPDHQTARKQMKNGFGGMLAIDLGTEEKARTVAQSTKVFLLAESLGGVESLVAYPPLMSHAVMSEEQRLERGIPPSLLRLSVGIEDIEDLKEDFHQAVANI